MTLVSLDDIRAAAGRIAGHIVRTPLLPAPWAGDLRLKPENLQPTGAFKMRGALNAIGLLAPEVRAAGVVTHSSGNHGQAVAWAARVHGVPAVVVMPEGAASIKVEATRTLGAEVVMVPVVERETAARRIMAERGMSLVPPYDDLGVIAGQGTLGAEIVEDFPDVETVLVPVGGGGLISGIAAAVAALSEGARVVGVEPELAADAADSMRRGERTGWDPALTTRTVADGVRTPIVGELTWPHLQAYVDEIVTVSEEAIVAAVGELARRGRVVAEPSGALATAAYLADPARFGASVAVVSGGNLDAAVLAAAIAPAGTLG